MKRRARLLAAALAIVALGGGRAAAAASVCDITGVERIVAIGDVHGAYDRFVHLLRTLGLVDDKLRWAGETTHLVQLGDVVDRGPDSRKALDLLRRLMDEAPRRGGAVHLLLGNHEAMRILGDLRFVTPGEYQAFVDGDSDRTREAFVERADPKDRDALRQETPLGEIEMRVAFGRRGVYGSWIRSLPAIVKIDGVVFVHGGLSPAVADLSCETVNSTVEHELDRDLDETRKAPLASLVAREDGPLWYRGLAQEPDTFAPEIDQILVAQHARAMVVGHTVTPDGRLRVRFEGKVVQIDTGMQAGYVSGGRASALEIRRGTFTAIYEDRLDVLTGPTADPAAR